MRLWATLAAAAAAQLSAAQLASVITTLAGGGAVGSDGGPATSVSLGPPTGVATDGGGNVFISDSGTHRLRRVAADTGVITTLAGTGVGGFSGDGGPGTSARLNSPYGVAVDGAGNVFIADFDNQRIRRLAAGTGVITTVAGNGTRGFGGDGRPATSARLNGPSGVAVDGAGNVFIADSSNQRIRRVAVSTGVIATVAGNGAAVFAGDGGAATSASLAYPYGVAVDGAGNVLIADTYNQRIRRVAAGTGALTTVAGNGGWGFSGDGGPGTSASLNAPFGVAVDAGGNLFIADQFNHRVRWVAAGTGVITTLAGTGEQGFSGDGGPGTSAMLAGYPHGVAVLGGTGVVIADTNSRRVRLLTFVSASATPSASLTPSGSPSGSVTPVDMPSSSPTPTRTLLPRSGTSSATGRARVPSASATRTRTRSRSAPVTAAATRSRSVKATAARTSWASSPTSTPNPSQHRQHCGRVDWPACPADTPSRSRNPAAPPSRSRTRKPKLRL